ncbi:hypothetical protein JTE90_022277 [Oedothorax gibbosus]|uniref:Uncharacterized protein n=1 Tax=Oedothorax gibbosus TaxID=931172 RepID=A0AAV6VY55_9ARAC|nr:hypothetical protein JTE90_022277 [Oedothorax gibbosus]
MPLLFGSLTQPRIVYGLGAWLLRGFSRSRWYLRFLAEIGLMKMAWLPSCDDEVQNRLPSLLLMPPLSGTGSQATRKSGCGTQALQRLQEGQVGGRAISPLILLAIYEISGLH